MTRRIDLIDDFLDVPEAERTQDGAVAKAAIAPEARCKACGAQAAVACRHCNDAVCARHYAVMYGLCTRCTGGGKGGRPKDEGAGRGRPDLGLPWIE